jgi:hypothetical protein
VQLEPKFSSICVIAIHRAPTGDFELILYKLESIINYHLKHKAEFFICDNIDYLAERYNKQCVNSLLVFFNFMSVANFHTKITPVLPLIMFLETVPGKVIFLLNGL